MNMILYECHHSYCKCWWLVLWCGMRQTTETGSGFKMKYLRMNVKLLKCCLLLPEADAGCSVSLPLKRKMTANPFIFGPDESSLKCTSVCLVNV